MVTLKQVSKAVPENKTGAVNKENYWTIVLLYFASFLVGLGIVAEVAANWQEIPNVVKLTGALFLMVVNSGAIWWTVEKDKPVLKQVFALIYAFLIMGVIGLIGQVFHLHSNITNACLLWALISWPLIGFAPRLLWLWVPLLMYGFRYNAYFMDDLVTEAALGYPLGEIAWKFNNVLLDFLRSYLAFFFILGYELWVNLGNQNNQVVVKPLRFYSGWLVLSLYQSGAYLADKISSVDTSHQMSVYFNFATPCFIVMLVIYFLNFKMKRKSFMPLFLLGVLLQNMLTYLRVHVYHFGPLMFNSADFALPVVFYLLLLMYADYYKMKRLFSLSVIAIVVWYIWTFEKNVFDLVPSLIVCAVMSLIAYRKRNRRLFNSGVILAVIRILAYYVDVENLQHMGLYLIGSGLLIISTILLLTKYSKVLWERKNEE